MLTLTSTATVGLGSNPFIASVVPVLPPNISNCNRAPNDLPPGVGDLNYCLPTPQRSTTDKVIPLYKPPAPKSIRERRAAHMVYNDCKYIEKYTEAIKHMKALPTNDSRSC